MRDLSLGAPLAEIGRETSHLAEALISAALGVLERELTAKHGAPDQPGFAVFGLGKLGGEDLNFSSDVDLVYLYREQGQTAGGTGRFDRELAVLHPARRGADEDALRERRRRLLLPGRSEPAPPGPERRDRLLAPRDAHLLRDLRPDVGARRLAQGPLRRRGPRARARAARGDRAVRLEEEPRPLRGRRAARDEGADRSAREGERRRRQARAGRDPRGRVLRELAPALARRAQPRAARAAHAAIAAQARAGRAALGPRRRRARGGVPLPPPRREPAPDGGRAADPDAPPARAGSGAARASRSGSPTRPRSSAS